MTRGRIAVSAVVTAVLLTGCQIEGTVDVGESEVLVDLTLTHRVSTTSNPCTDIDMPRLRKEVSITPDGMSCRFSGRLLHSQVPDVGGTFVASADSIMLTASAPPRNGALPVNASLNLTFTFPGEVVTATANGTVSGSRVHFGDIRAADAEGIGIVARPTPVRGVAVWWWGLSGLVGGTVVAAGATWLWRRRGHPDAAGDTPSPDAGEPMAGRLDGALDPAPERWAASEAEPAASTKPGPGLPPEDPSVWASDDLEPGERTP